MSTRSVSKCLLVQAMFTPVWLSTIIWTRTWLLGRNFVLSQKLYFAAYAVDRHV